MTLEQRRNKLAELLNSADLDLLKELENVILSYYEKLNDPYQDLPETVKQLLQKSIEETENGEVRLHEEVVSDIRAKYNIPKVK